MGCLKKIFSLILLILAFIGFKTIGGMEMVQKKYEETINPPPEIVKQEAKKIADFSKVPTTFKIERTVNILGNKAVVADFPKTQQKMLVVEPMPQIKLTKKDIVSKDVGIKIEKIEDKFKYQPIRTENFKIIDRGYITTMGQKAPYIKFKTDLVGAKAKNAEGMISVAQNPNGKEKILISINFNGKYSQVNAERFFSKLK